MDWEMKLAVGRLRKRRITPTANPMAATNKTMAEPMRYCEVRDPWRDAETGFATAPADVFFKFSSVWFLATMGSLTSVSLDATGVVGANSPGRTTTAAGRTGCFSSLGAGAATTFNALVGVSECAFCGAAGTAATSGTGFVGDGMAAGSAGAFVRIEDGAIPGFVAPGATVSERAGAGIGLPGPGTAADGAGVGLTVTWGVISVLAGSITAF
jgi:hypothetical protein